MQAAGEARALGRFGGAADLGAAGPLAGVLHDWTRALQAGVSPAPPTAASLRASGSVPDVRAGHTPCPLMLSTVL